MEANSQVEILLKRIRRKVFENQLKQADSLLNIIDTLNLSESDLGSYFLTKGFYIHKGGNPESAIDLIEKASKVISENGNDELLADLDLIRAVILEESDLPSESSKSFFNALDYYQNYENDPLYFYTLLGLARTSQLKENFIHKAQIFIQNSKQNKYNTILYQTKAIYTEDPTTRQILFLKALEYNDEYQNIRNEIELYISLALNCFILKQIDSAFFYINNADSLIGKSGLSGKILVNYYIAKSYLNFETGNKDVADIAVEKAIANAKHFLGLLGEAYWQKYLIETTRHNYERADEFLLEYIKCEKSNMKSMQGNQIALLSIQYDTYMKDEAYKREKLYRLTAILVLFTLVLVFSFLFYYKKHTSLIVKDLNSKYQIASDRLVEHIYGELNEATLGQAECVERKISISQTKNWLEFVSIFQIHYPLFESKLIRLHPDLTSTDLKYCKCFFCGLSNYTVSNLMNVSPDAVRKAKKKMQKFFNKKELGEVTTYLKIIDSKSLPFK